MTTYLTFAMTSRRLFFFLVLAVSIMLSHQMSSQNAVTTVNLVLADVLSVASNSAASGRKVDFHYQNVTDHNSEKQTTIPTSLIITFSKRFDLKDKANEENFNNGNNTIPVNVLTIQRNESSQITGDSSLVIPSAQDQALISGADHGSRLNLNLEYIIPQERSSPSDMLSKPAGNYTQEITYTATAR